MAHSATLCHDDIIDGALTRRSAPALWTATGPCLAVLLGDVLLCVALRAAAETPTPGFLSHFLHAIHETCLTEVEHEFARGQALDGPTCLRIARGKTGPLFALAARAAGGGDERLADVLEQAGYRVGTAYQLADDLIDRIGEEGAVGKTLGTDSKRKKSTLAQVAGGPDVCRKAAVEELQGALALLDGAPKVQGGLLDFLEQDLLPAVCRQDPAFPRTIQRRIAP